MEQKYRVGKSTFFPLQAWKVRHKHQSVELKSSTINNRNTNSNMNISVLSFKFNGFRQIPLGREGLYVSPDQVIHASGSHWTNDAWAKGIDDTAWRLALCPDHAASDGGEVMLSCRVDKEESDTGDEIEIDTHSEAAVFTIILRDADGSSYHEISVECSDDRFYVKRFVERRVVVKEENNILGRANGSLHVDLIIQPKQRVAYSQVSSPNMLANNMLALLDDWRLADIFFEFHNTIRCGAHRFVLRVMAPDLERLCIIGDPNKICNVVIENTSVDVFKYFLRYIYGGGLPSEDFLLENGKELIDVSNRYGVTSLKMDVEAFLVTSNVINVTNVVDYFLFADGLDCALLKENALAVFLSRPNDIIGSEHFHDMVAKSPKLMTELLKSSIDNGRMPVSTDADSHDLKKLSVIALRQKLQQKGLDMDGSKEMLISRLEASEVDVESEDGESEGGSEEYVHL